MTTDTESTAIERLGAACILNALVGVIGYALVSAFVPGALTAGIVLYALFAVGVGLLAWGGD